MGTEMTRRRRWHPPKLWLGPRPLPEWWSFEGPYLNVSAAGDVFVASSRGYLEIAQEPEPGDCPVSILVKDNLRDDFRNILENAVVEGTLLSKALTTCLVESRRYYLQPSLDDKRIKLSIRRVGWYLNSIYLYGPPSTEPLSPESIVILQNLFNWAKLELDL